MRSSVRIALHRPEGGAAAHAAAEQPDGHVLGVGPGAVASSRGHLDAYALMWARSWLMTLRSHARGSNR